MSKYLQIRTLRFLCREEVLGKYSLLGTCTLGVLDERADAEPQPKPQFGSSPEPHLQLPICRLSANQPGLHKQLGLQAIQLRKVSQVDLEVVAQLL